MTQQTPTNGAQPTPQIRLATKEDVPEILAMIKELADFEKALDRCHATEATLSKTLSLAPCASDPHPTPGYAQTFLLTLPSSETTTNGTASNGASANGHAKDAIAGMALYFNNYSTWLACPGIYLEDLYIRPAYRRRGYATLLLKKLAAEASRISDGQGRLEWSCLRWNKNALAFYEWLGGRRQEEWIGIRVEGVGLGKMAAVQSMK